MGLRNIERRLACQCRDPGVAGHSLVPGPRHDGRGFVCPCRSGLDEALQKGEGVKVGSDGPRLRVVLRRRRSSPRDRFLAALLHSFEHVVIVGEATSGEEGRRAHRTARNRTWRCSTFRCRNSLRWAGGYSDGEARPAPLTVAFVTRVCDEYAIHAFEVNAIDYLLKPVEKGPPGRNCSKPRARPD